MLTFAPLCSGTVVCAGARVLCRYMPGRIRQDTNSVLMTHGVAIGDVQTDRVVIWSRADRDATLHVRVKARSAEPLHEKVKVTSVHDYAGTITVKGLKPAYEYRVWFDDEGKKNDDKRNNVTGSFRTAPQVNKERRHLCLGRRSGGTKRVPRRKRRFSALLNHQHAGTRLFRRAGRHDIR